ncbi:MAG: 2-isopropylmalate synthase [Lautropia sp.]|nr:2-isopropylmalate synthase [Lautropia sp.]
MMNDPSVKYSRPEVVDLPGRRWPSNVIKSAPVWLSTDLRDGNQALFEPMGRAKKIAFFQELVRIGFKEIEIGFPAASQTDFDVVREVIEKKLVPDDVTLMVMTQARPELIERTVQAVRGARRVIVHIYNATAPLWRDVVFRKGVPEVMELVRESVCYFGKLSGSAPEVEWVLQYSPETFCMTELEVSLQACNVAIDAWRQYGHKQVIINLPTTVEVSTPNVFADQIEWMNERLNARDDVVLSVHPHNDRGTGVACAELALLAGAQRVEGCVFGNGERCGNVDLVTLALNLYVHGVSPDLDFSDINRVARMVEDSTGIAIHPRHPYVGDLAFTAFSGSHQDAINKGMCARHERQLWAVPYLPIDPADIGRTYDGIVRVNSQSGKGGIAYLLEQHYGVLMPRRMQIEFSSVVQKVADASEAELSAEELWTLFDSTYLNPPFSSDSPVQYVSHTLRPAAEGDGMEIEMIVRSSGAEVGEGVFPSAAAKEDGTFVLSGSGTGPVDAAVSALGLPLMVHCYEERNLGRGSDAVALALIELSLGGKAGSCFGAARHRNLATASIIAVLSAFCRIYQR